MTTTNEKDKEWLQFMEFIRRKYGNNSSEFIRINDYNNRASNSVAAYYKTKYPTASININDNLETLLKNQSFTTLFRLNDPVEVTKFTEIYSDTDSLMQKLNTTLNTGPRDDLYITCNPSDSTAGNGSPDESTTTSGGPASTTTTPAISLPNMYNDVVSHIVISILILAVVIFIGYLFTHYLPEHAKTAASNAFETLKRVQPTTIKFGIAKSVLRNMPIKRQVK
jgi:hypothetical protein